MKYDLMKKQTEIEQKDKKIKELEGHIQELKQYHQGPQSNAYSSVTSNSEMQTKQLKDEIQRLKSLSKNRDEILVEIDQKNHNLWETETQLKLTKNDIEILQSKNKTQDKLNMEMNEKNEALEKKVQLLKEQNLKT